MKLSILKYFLIAFTTYTSSYFICSFFGESGQNMISHLTGFITMTLQLIATFCVLISDKLNKSQKITACLASVLMFVGYFIYIYFEISPSVISKSAHTASSVLFDIATSGFAIYVIETARRCNKCQTSL